MIASLSRPVRRLAAVALLMLAAAVLVLVAVVPYFGRLGHLEEQIESERVLLGRFSAIAAQQSEIGGYDQAGQAAADSAAYLKGETEALKAAGLQSALSELANGARVRLYSTRALGQRERNDVRLIGVRVQFKAEIEQLRLLLHRIEASRPFLFVEALQVQPVGAFSERDPDLAGMLDVRLDVFGAMPGRKG
jgi:general secretion pathway protein M